ncbi:signal peptidase I [Microbacterium enclense]|uniref:signal peptidase I n=1 Tax=Microbacterium enclense TaxID=993073 RepID=UPI003F7DF73F
MATAVGRLRHPRRLSARAGDVLVAAPSTRREGREAARRLRRRRRVLVVTAAYATILVTVTVWALFSLRVATVPSASMQPTIAVGSHILIQRGGDPAKGQVIVFDDPGGWLTPAETTQASWPSGVLDAITFTNTSSLLVKRVIGLPGQTVTGAADGTITVDGTVLNEPYVSLQQGTGPSFSVTVPEGCLFVLGDNRGDSADSRYHLDENDGCVPISSVVGRVTATLSPTLSALPFA